MKRSYQRLLVTILAVVTVLLCAHALRTNAAPRASGPAHGTAPSSSVAPPLLAILVIGDSAAAGGGASVRQLAWVDRVARQTGWDMTNTSIAGAGYLARAAGEGTCERERCPSFATILSRVGEASPDVVLIAGGKDDLEPGRDLTRPARSFYAAVRAAFPEASIVALNPGYDVTAAVDASAAAEAIRAALGGVEGEFADIGQPLTQQAIRVADDGVEPSDVGHRVIARKVVEAIRTLS